MLASQRSLAEVQLNRNTVAEVAEFRTPLREAALELFRRRNAVLDAMFYDVGTVTAGEAQDISPWLAREGSLLIVPPTGQGPLCRCGAIDAFAGHGGTDIRILTVAGVESRRWARRPLPATWPTLSDSRSPPWFRAMASPTC